MKVTQNSQHKLNRIVIHEKILLIALIAVAAFCFHYLGERIRKDIKRGETATAPRTIPEVIIKLNIT